MRRYEYAIAARVGSVVLEPNGPMVHGMLGGMLCYAGRIDDGMIL